MASMRGPPTCFEVVIRVVDIGRSSFIVDLCTMGDETLKKEQDEVGEKRKAENI